MKKILMLAAIASTALAAHALEDTEYYLDRSVWTVHSCSNAPVSGGEGTISNMFDDNLSTYWHSTWTSGNVDVTTQTHWFTIDLGSSQTFHGFDYWGRPSGSNGQIKKGKIYVSDSPFADFGDASSEEVINAAKAYYDNTENHAVKEFEFNYDSTPTGVRECRFDDVTGRYVLVLTSETVGNFASGAEFKLIGTKDDTTTGRVSHDRSAWTVTTCSVYESEGPAAMMFDDNLSTYWHQNWSSDTNLANFHWFVIDMQESQDVDGFEYWRRQGRTNGQFYKGKVYVSDEDFAFAAGDHASVKTYTNNLNNTPAALFTFDYSSNPDGVRVCEFEKTQHGRYILVVISDAGKADGGMHACCAEFKLFKDTNPAQKARWFEGIAAAKTLAEQYRNMANLISGGLPATDLPVGLNGETIDAAIANKNTQLQNFVNSFNGKQVLIQCGERRSNAYLTTLTRGNGAVFNTAATATPDAVWEIKAVDGGFRLCNRTTGFYIGTNNAIAAAGDAQTFVPGVINTNFVSFAKAGTSNLLNIDKGSSNLTAWSDATDEGSSWAVSLATSANYNFAEPEISTAEAPKYYRIVNARWMYNANPPCLSIVGMTATGGGVGEYGVQNYAQHPGNYWRVEQSDESENGVKIVNLLDFTMDRQTAEGLENYLIVTEKGTTLYLAPFNFDGIKAYGISKDESVGVNSCLDVSGQFAKFQWHPTNEGRKNGDNGSAWYFIPATDAEIATAIQTYVGNLSAQMPMADPSLEALFGSKFYEESVLPYVYAGEMTISGLNAAKASNQYTAESAATLNAAVEAKVSELANRHFLIHNKNANYQNCYLTVSEDATAPTADPSGLNAVWSFVPLGEGNSFLMTSLGHGGSIFYTTEQSKAIPVVDEGLPYSIAYNAMVPGFSFSLILPEEITTETNRYALHQSNNTTVCKWQTDNIAGSHWMLEVLDNAEVTFTLEGDIHTINLGEGVTLNDHESATGHQLTITKLTESDPSASLPADIELFAVEPQDGTYTLDASHFTDGSAQVTRLPAGSYTMTAPAGMFLVNGKPSAALTSTLKVKDNGVVTGIDEITAADAIAPTAIYDLQGRKLAAPIKGINIINGRKVLVK